MEPSFLVPSLPLSLPTVREDVCVTLNVPMEVEMPIGLRHWVGNTPVNSNNLSSFAPVMNDLKAESKSEAVKTTLPRWVYRVLW